MKRSDDFIIYENERKLLIRIMNDVLSNNVFFSVGEMSTITSWSIEDVKIFIEKLKSGRSMLYSEEQRFLIHTLYAWYVATKYKRVNASSLEIYLSEEICDRLD